MVFKHHLIDDFNFLLNLKEKVLCSLESLESSKADKILFKQDKVINFADIFPLLILYSLIMGMFMSI